MAWDGLPSGFGFALLVAVLLVGWAIDLRSRQASRYRVLSPVAAPGFLQEIRAAWAVRAFRRLLKIKRRSSS